MMKFETIELLLELSDLLLVCHHARVTAMQFDSPMTWLMTMLESPQM
jgi:hypothetical protein